MRETGLPGDGNRARPRGVPTDALAGSRPAKTFMHAPIPPDVLRRRGPGLVEFVALVALMMGITAYAVDNVLPAFPVIAQAYGVADPNDLQLLVYVYMAGFGLLHLVYGPAADIWGRRPVFLVGLAVFTAGCVIAILADSLQTLLVARFIQGAGAAAGRVLAMAIVRDRFSAATWRGCCRSPRSCSSPSRSSAPAIGGLILAFADWHAIFASMLAAGLMLGIWFAWRMPETLHPEFRMTATVAPVIAGIRATVTCRAALGYGTAFGCLFGCIMAYVGSAQQIFGGDVYGLGAWFPAVFGSVAAMMGVAALVNSRLVRRFGMHRMSHIGILTFLTLACAQVALAFATDGRPPLIPFILLLAAGQFFSSLAMPNFNALAMEPLGAVAGTASSFIGFYTTLLGAGFGAIVGQHFDGTVKPLALGYLALALAAVLVVVVTERGRLFGRSASNAAR
jgi:DHA1 family bicyclomycin/chloramphenicol resistance-like MFS transporter